MSDNLIALASATGDLGFRIAQQLLDRGATLRVLVRPASAAKPEIARLRERGAAIIEVELADKAALTQALAGVACVVSTLSGLRDVIVDAQTHLLAAAVAAGVPRFIPSDFAIDFTKLPVGSNRNLDLRREFGRRLDEAPIQATSILNGMFMDLLTGQAPVVLFPIRRVLYWGSADQPLDFTTIADTAAYTALAALDPTTPRYPTHCWPNGHRAPAPGRGRRCHQPALWSPASRRPLAAPAADTPDPQARARPWGGVSRLAGDAVSAQYVHRATPPGTAGQWALPRAGVDAGAHSAGGKSSLLGNRSSHYHPLAFSTIISMKALPLLLAALLLPVGATLAQTVLPSGAVAPTGTSTPSTVPGSQPVVTPNMRSAGSPRGKARDAKIPGMSRHEERQLRKMAKARPDDDKPRKNQ